jgi:hypothetical protein
MAKSEGIAKPNVTRIAGIFGVAEPTLRKHIKNPKMTIQKEQHEAMQLLSAEEEDELTERVIFMDSR